MNALAKFPSPYELKAPKGAEGWRDLYPYYALFQDEPALPRNTPSF